MTKVKVHPVADLFPMMSQDELDALAADIRERGLLQPIIVSPSGQILDGRNRAAACQIAGVEPAWQTYDGDDPAGYALAANIQRRSINTSQRHLIMEQARRLNGSRAKKGEISLSEGTRRGLIDSATLLDYGSPELVAEVAAGRMPLYKAVEEARAIKRQQQERNEREAAVKAEAPDQWQLVEAGQQTLDDAWLVLTGRLSEAQRQADEQNAEYAKAVQRSKSYLEAFLSGLSVAVGIPSSPMRGDVLTALGPHDQKRYSQIEDLLPQIRERIKA